ncbi:hypothetical protein FJZ23_02175 [Candidatus Parcubacteria bacterium]|nr:hypothetical protein [Candidatus Parcubacteria bacterium]
MFSTFFDASAWFTFAPAQVGGTSGRIIFGVFLLLFVLGLVARMVALHKTQDHHLRELGLRVGSLCITMGVLGVLLSFFSYERIRLFGARFWYLLWLIGLIVWAAFLARYAYKTVPMLKAREVEQEERRKYLPSRRRK